MRRTNVILSQPSIRWRAMDLHGLDLISGSVSGLLLALAYPAFSLSFLAWVAFIPWLFAIHRAGDLRTVFWASAAAGLTFFLVSCYWIAHVSGVGCLLLCGYLAAFFIPFGLFVHTFYRKRQSAILWGSFCWVGLEFLRGNLLSGFPWNTLASSQAGLLPLIQMASVTGAYGVSFVVIMANLIFFEAWLWASGKDLKLTKPLCVVGSVLIAAAFIYGQRELAATPVGATAEPLRLAAVQPNIPQEQKWDPAFHAQISGQLSALTREAGKTKPLLIAWPETSVPGEIRHEESLQRYTQSLAQEAGAPLLIGSQDSEPGAVGATAYYNAAVLMHPERGVIEAYRKTHLVPFGEFLPGARWFPIARRFIPIPGDFTPGKELTTFGLRGPALRWIDNDGSLRSEIRMIRFGAVICFEDTFAELFRRLCMQNLDFVVNLTNDGWFGHSGAAMQHANLAIFRAVENRIALLRATNTGYTCLIDPYGRIVSEVKKDGSIFVPGVLSAEITPLRVRTLYSQMGDFFAHACLILALVRGFLMVQEVRRK